MVLEIRTTPRLLSKFRIMYDQDVWRANSGATKPLVTGHVEMVCVDKSNKLVPIPDVVIKAMADKYGANVPP